MYVCRVNPSCATLYRARCCLATSSVHLSREKKRVLNALPKGTLYQNASPIKLPLVEITTFETTLQPLNAQFVSEQSRRIHRGGFKYLVSRSIAALECSQI